MSVKSCYIIDHEKELNESCYSDADGEHGTIDGISNSSEELEDEAAATNDTATAPTSHDSDLDDFLERLKQKYSTDNN